MNIFIRMAAAERALAAGMADWFLNRLDGPAKLRVLHDFGERALFLDIETTALDPYAEVTSVATWRNGVAKCFVRGFNLDQLLPELAAAELLVTFNGKRFDLPFLRREFGVDLMQPHLDLMYPLRSLGYRGGLKVCERQLGFRRAHSEGADGMEAVRLWYAWRTRRNAHALRRLIAYNVEDTYCLACGWRHDLLRRPYPAIRWPVAVPVRRRLACRKFWNPLLFDKSSFS